MNRRPFALALAAAVAWSAPVKAQVIYTIRDLGTFGGDTFGRSINNAGQVTGFSRTSQGFARAFRTAPGGTLSDPAADLGTLPGHLDSFGVGINSSGQVVGRSVPNVGDQRGFRTAATGRLSDPDAALGVSSSAGAINDAGQVTGQLGTTPHAYRSTPNGVPVVLTDLGTFGGTFSAGNGINASGQITGFAANAAGQNRAFRTTSTGNLSDPAADLGTLGGTSSLGEDINDAGQVTGSSRFEIGNFAVRAFRTTATGRVSDPGADLGTLGGASSEGYGINSFGVVVGYAQDANGNQRAFLFDTQMRDLNLLIPSQSGWLLTQAHDINDVGQITGQGVFNGQQRAFVLTPVPEPSAVALAGGGLAVGWVARRRRAARRRAEVLAV